MKKYVLVALICNIVLTSCYRTVSCKNRYVTPAFIGFNLSDLDTLIVREYKKDNNFFTLLDTALIISNTNILTSGSSNDTTVVLLNHISGREKYIFSEHDWQIYIPALNKVVSMSGFISPQTDKKCILGGDLCPDCSNPINSFLQDGQQVIPQYRYVNYFGNSYITYIHF